MEIIWHQRPCPPTWKLNTAGRDVPLPQLRQSSFPTPIGVPDGLLLDGPINWVVGRGVTREGHQSNQPTDSFYAPSHGGHHFIPEWRHYPSSTVWLIWYVNTTVRTGCRTPQKYNVKDGREAEALPSCSLWCPSGSHNGFQGAVPRDR